MILYTVLCMINTLETSLDTNNSFKILIYPEDSTRKVSFNFTVDENICQLSDITKLSILMNTNVIHEEVISGKNGIMHIY